LVEPLGFATEQNPDTPVHPPYTISIPSDKGPGCKGIVLLTPPLHSLQRKNKGKITMTSKETAPSTVGEELFLVHLHRETPEHLLSDKDGPESPPRKRSRSVGEELFEIHLKRSQGLEPDYDVPLDKKPQAKATKGTKKVGGTAHVIHLRNRDVPPLVH
jgi:hypothetical protein